MTKILTTLFSSKKFCALLVTFLVLLATRKLGLSEAEATEISREIVAVVAAFMVGQGVADIGKEQAKVEAAGVSAGAEGA